ncbi:MAG: phosphoribosylanthranilate isomerase [Alphaproteobacteria bacterium]
MATMVKTCGLRTVGEVDAACDAGAALVGFVFFPSSPRNVSLDEAAPLFDRARAGGRNLVQTVALTVDPSVDQVRAIMKNLSPDLIQFHGSESPVTIAAIRAATGCRAMKAIGISTAGDLDALPAYRSVCDMILIDAKAPKTANRPGGLGVPFDWSLLAGFDPGVPWLLAGGLNADNVVEALTQTRAPGVDVSSGIESAPGTKDLHRIGQFIDAVRSADELLAA